MSTGWNMCRPWLLPLSIINLLGNEYWLEPSMGGGYVGWDYKPTGK